MIFLGRGWTGLGGSEATGRRSTDPRPLSRGPSRHPVWTWPRVPTARPGQLGGHLPGCLPPFSCERQAGRDTGTGGRHLLVEHIVLRPQVPPQGRRVEDEEEADRRRFQGRGWLSGAGPLGAAVTICARPSQVVLGSAPLRCPLPAQGQAAPMQGLLSPSQGAATEPGSAQAPSGCRVCPPGNPASVTWWPELGTVPRKHLLAAPLGVSLQH